MNNNQRKKGILINYAMLIINSVINVFMTPFILSTLGDVQYGIYHTVNAFAANLLIADLGIGTLLTRYLSIYMEKKDERNQENFVAMGIILSAICSLLIIVIGIFMFFRIEPIYKNTMNASEILISQKIFIISMINVAVSTFDKAFFGIVNAYEKYVVSRGTILVKVLLKAVLIVAVLSYRPSAISLVSIDLLLTLFMMLFITFYVFKKLKVRAKLYSFDKKILASSLTFIFAVFLNSIVTQVNSSVGKILIGSMINTSVVAVYTIAMVIVTTNNMIANSIGGVYLPHITKRIYAGADAEEISKIVSRPGRVNFMICGLILMVFGLYGKEFIQLWVGEGYEMAYYIAMILLVSYLVPHMESVMGCVLDAKNKRLVRSAIILVMAVFNIVVTMVLLPKIGVIGAPIGTAVAMILGHWICINLYYKKLIGLRIRALFYSITKGTLICFLVSVAASIPMLFIHKQNFYIFILKCLYTVITFFVLQLKFGFNLEEKEMLRSFFKRMKKRRRFI